MRLDHPFETTQTNDTELINVGANSFISSSSTDPDIAHNSMNYSIITIDGKPVSNMNKITSQQLQFIRKEIQLQNQGYGFHSKKVGKNYDTFFLNYWLNIPGTPVKKEVAFYFRAL